MSHIYDRPVRARLAQDGQPQAFWWRGRWQAVAAVLDDWVYRQPWWEVVPPRERICYRVLVVGGGVFELIREEDGTTRIYRVFD